MALFSSKVIPSSIASPSVSRTPPDAALPPDKFSAHVALSYNKLNDDTEGYMLPGEFPSFKIYDASEDIFYDATPSTQIPWQDGITPVIDSLIVQ